MAAGVAFQALRVAARQGSHIEEPTYREQVLGLLVEVAGLLESGSRLSLAHWTELLIDACFDLAAREEDRHQAGASFAQTFERLFEAAPRFAVHARHRLPVVVRRLAEDHLQLLWRQILQARSLGSLPSA